MGWIWYLVCRTNQSLIDAYYINKQVIAMFFSPSKDDIYHMHIFRIIFKVPLITITTVRQIYTSTIHHPLRHITFFNPSDVYQQIIQSQTE